jgi:hypothetical protein
MSSQKTQDCVGTESVRSIAAEAGVLDAFAIYILESGISIEAEVVLNHAIGNLAWHLMFEHFILGHVVYGTFASNADTGYALILAWCRVRVQHVEAARELIAVRYPLVVESLAWRHPVRALGTSTETCTANASNSVLLISLP